MLKKVLIVLIAVTFYLPVSAQHDSAANNSSSSHDSSSHLRISLLTCGPGEEVWETFGHTCLRIIDSTKTGRERDVIYNYGFLDSSPDNTVMHQFLSSHVRVYLGTSTFREFEYQYTQEKRSVIEQVFLLSDSEKRQVLAFLNYNLRRENKYYDYNSAYDNCSTRTLGIFTKLFGPAFVPGRAIPDGARLTFRELTDRYGPQKIQHKYWFSFGMEILFGSRPDRVVNNTEAMYLSEYLMDGMDSATIDGHLLCAPKTTLLENKIVWPDVVNEPVIILWIIAILTIAGLVIPKLKILGKIMSTFLLLLTGLVGCYLVYFWAIDAEPYWKENYNVLWALPANLVIPFFGPRVKAKYAIVALVLLAVAIIVSILKIQHIPFPEIGSVILALIFVYGIMYRNATRKNIMPEKRK